MLRFIGVICCWWLLACSADQDTESNFGEKPTHLIPMEQMANITTDLNLMESYISEIRLVGLLNRDSTERLYNQLFNKYEITASQLEENIEYYATQMGALDTIYSWSVSDLVERQIALEDIQVEEEELKYLDRAVLVQLLKKEAFAKFWNDTIKALPFRDSAVIYARKHPEVLDSLSLRMFAYNFSFYCSNEKKFALVKELVLATD